MSARIVAPNDVSIAEAAEAIRRGELVVIPTETVYGLAADAMSPSAIARVFAAKGRPAENPLIVHVSSIEEAGQVAVHMPEMAKRLGESFWPGPLTLVLPRAESLPREVTGNLDTVAVRIPNHLAALALIRAAGTPLAAPSANPFTRLSPTRADHLDSAILAHVAMVLDAGPCEVGVESTVLDLSGGAPRILRPGGISREAIERVIGPIADDPSDKEASRSPGQYPRHYSPRTPVKLVAKADSDAAALVFSEPRSAHQLRMPANPLPYAARLYAALHELDTLGAGEIQIELPPLGPAWEAIHDRLKKASA